jgi:hypothetical protein
MHDCQKFREDWIAGVVEDSVDCQECLSFCEEAAVILQATETQQVPEFAEAYWDQYDDRLRVRLYRENVSRTRRFYFKWSATAAAAAVLVVAVTWGGMRIPPATDNVNATPEIEFVDDHIQGLNPTVVAFLSQSELFLRNFTNIDPSYKEDLQDAQARAKQGLAEIETQKMRAADFAPVRIALDEYETVLRDIKNVDSADDVADIQSLIRNTGLIASMKAYQPQVMLVSQR